MCRKVHISHAILTAFAGSIALFAAHTAAAEDARTSRPMAVSSATAAPTPSLSVFSNDSLSIGYLTPAYGAITLGVSPRAPLSTAALNGMASGLSMVHAFDVGSEYTVPVAGAEFGIFGGYGERPSTLALTPSTSWSFGASVGYAGFYLRGGVSETTPLGPLFGTQGLQAGFGYETGALDLRLTYLTSQGVGTLERELDKQQWSIGGIYRISSRLRLNADAFYGTGDNRGTALSAAPPTVAPPGTGARVGVQLRF
jgi:hypothetical protein